MILSFTFCLILALVQNLCYCDDHVYGSLNSGNNIYVDKVLYDKVLFTKDSPEPKNYTLVFKYICSESSPNITHAIFEVQRAKSHGVIEVSTEKDKEKTLQATLNIINGTNIRVIGKIFGANIVVSDSINPMLYRNKHTPKTFTVVYGHNSTQSRNQIVNLGHRQPGDELIGFKSENVTLQYRFAQKEFEFKDNTKHITSVNFSLNSPSAIVFVNTSYVGESGLNVIIYDLNMPFFEANMSVYGYNNFNKPATYKPIVLSNKSER